MKTYLGDGVYANWDGHHFVLTAENGVQVLNIIYLDAEVLHNFIDFADRVAKQEQEREVEI